MAGTRKTIMHGAKEKSVARKMRFVHKAPNAVDVHLAGDFNDWDTKADPMEKDENGIWRTTISLKSGRYEYRFFVDGTWHNDAACSSCVPNIFGSWNCVRIVK